jgi:hypothetical protein
MRLTYLAHACFLVESGGRRLVTDPWLDGPTYLSAWWHFPRPAASATDLVGVDYVYLTHEHVDHFHEPTLRRLPRSTPILIGRFLTARFRRQLEAMGFYDVRELPHGEEVDLGGGLRATSYQYRADDTALVLRDDEATVLNMNDCLLRAASLEHLLQAHPRVDLLAMSFANAEAYPIVYQFEDPAERVDWDDRSRFDGFLEKVRRIGPRAFVPFASMFSFLSPELQAINDRIVSPGPLIDRAARGEVAARGLAMNPGDLWTPGGGHEVRNPLDWSSKAQLLRSYAELHRDELEDIRAAEIVPGGREALRGLFSVFFRDFADRVPLPLRLRLDLSVRFDVRGPAGGVFWARFHKGRVDLSRPQRDDVWEVRLELDDWPLWRVLSGADTWQTLGISCRYRAHLRRQVREREVYFWFLLYLSDLGYLSPWGLATPRALSVLMHRRREVGEYLQALVGGTFVENSLRGKFVA